MPQHSIPDLYEDYAEYRRLDLSYEQFLHFVFFFPPLLVVSTDGRVDAEEWEFVAKLADSLARLLSREGADADAVEELQEKFFREFQYLTDNFDTWERRYIKSLKNHLASHPEDKPLVLDTLYVFAEASEDVCEKEQVMIEHLRSELGLENLPTP